MPYKTETRLTQLDSGKNVGTQLAINLCFCMCFVSSFYVLFLIKERESRSKLLQFVGGVHVFTFWLTHLFWDMLTLTLTTIIVVVTLLCFQEPGFKEFSEICKYVIYIFVYISNIYCIYEFLIKVVISIYWRYLLHQCCRLLICCHIGFPLRQQVLHVCLS